MTWDELFEKQFKEVDAFIEVKREKLKEHERKPNITGQEINDFNAQWKKEREELYERHKAEAEQYLDRREAEAKRLAHFKKMAKDYPENEYWAEAAERMENKKKQEREEEIRRFNERQKAQSKGRDQER